MKTPPLTDRRTSVREKSTRRTGGTIPLLLCAAAIALLAIFLVLPVLLATGKGFYLDGQLSGYWFTRVITNRVLMSELGNGLALASVTTLVSLFLAVPLAVLRARARFPGQGLLGALVMVPLVLPPFVGALSIQRLLGQFGVLNLILEKIGLLDLSTSLPPDWLQSGFVGVVILQSLHLFPILYLTASAALANIDPAYAEAARNLGASPLRTFRRITLPLMRSGLFAGGTLVFIWSFTDIGTPAIIGYPHLVPYRIFQVLASAEINPKTYSLVFVLLSSSVTLYVLGKFLFGRSVAGESSKATVAVERRRLGVWGTLAAWGLFASVIFLALLPHVGVILLGTADRWINTVVPESFTWRHLKFVMTSPETPLGSPCVM